MSMQEVLALPMLQFVIVGIFSIRITLLLLFSTGMTNIRFAITVVGEPTIKFLETFRRRDYGPAV